ncbi:GAF domain-containing protein [Phormidium sp. FACHB-592]|uniref:histidine kinase n=1 Tax=Stenomitos frigidus AS-A4 TaxID=2933935 RepID=A0ABV0KK26_9CYAN|nr:GAF domain-containing protein [Phormidium sp. FACHB-592]MBD2072717.1 GAF domain-containing protein [Phormidium sp. FACHB-592]
MQARLLPNRSLWGLLLLLVAGFLGNYFRWTLFFDIDFLFGSIAVWLVVCLYGVRWGTVAAFLAGLCTYVIWHHPYTTLTFTLEALFVGWLFHRRQQNNIVVLDAVFWLLIGMPLVWFFYAIILHVDSTQAFIILLKQPVNGVFNALIASLLLTHLPLHRWVARPPAISTLTLQQTLFNLLVAFVMVPTLLLIVLASHQVVDDIRMTAQSDLNDASRYLTVEVRTWYEQRLAAVHELAKVALDTATQSGTLRQDAEFAQRIFPDFQHLHVLDETGQRLLDVGYDAALDSFDDNVYFEQLQRSPQPFLSSARRLNQSAKPTVLIGVPIRKDGRLIGAVLGELDLKFVTTLFRANVGEQALNITLLDQQQTVVASTQAEWIGAKSFDWRKQGTVRSIGDQTYHWLPTMGSPLVMVQWSRSLFVKEATISSEFPWVLLVQMAATPHVRHIEQVHIQNMAVLLLVSGFAPIAAFLVSRQLVKPVSQLAHITTNLPDKLLEQAPIPWAQSQVTEFALLAQNFRLMAASLQQKFGEIHQANATLEHRVQERTQALQQTNIALQESEERFRQMAENIREVFWMGSVDKDALLYISPAYEEIWGRTCQSLFETPQSFVDAIHPDDRPRVIAAFAKQIQGTYSEEYRIIQPNGSIRWIWDRAFPICNAAGRVYRLVGVAQDITERKQAETVVRQQAERERLLGAIALHIRRSLNLDDILNTTVAEIREFLQTDRVIVYQFQADWSGIVIVESVAEGWQSIWARQIKDACFAEINVEDYKHGRTQAISDIYAEGLAACYVELLAQLQVRANLVVPILQGDLLWGLLVAQQCRAPRSWQHSEIDFLKQLAIQVAIAIHQSELYQHEQRLNTILEQQVEERTAQLQQALRYEALVKRMTDKVRDSLDEAQILQTAVEELVHGLELYGCDTALFNFEQGTMTIAHSYTNGAFASQPEVTLATHFSDIYPQLLNGQSLQFCELAPKFMDSAWQPSAIFACPMIDDQGVLGKLRLFRSRNAVFSEPEIRLVLQIANQCAIALRQARLYQTAQIQVKVLEELNQLKDDFLSTVSHELRTPISNMKMAIHMLKTQPTEERRDRYMEILQRECAREAELINDLLDLQRLASGTRVLELEAIALQEWLEELIEPFQERTQSRQQTLRVNIAPGLSVWTSDRASLSRILAELLNNACKYTPPGETIDLFVQPVSATTSDNTTAQGNLLALPATRLRLSVCNSGVEIPAQALSHIFEKFYRIPGGDLWKQGGTGLGLALVQKLTEHIGATIQVESYSNRTCFVVEL